MCTVKRAKIGTKIYRFPHPCNDPTHRGSGKYCIKFPTGERFYFCYEEMVELFGAGVNKERGNESLEDMKHKAQIVFAALPVTDY